MTKIRKAFTISLMVVTALAMTVVVAPQANAAASAGDLIKMDGLSSVYYLGADGKRYVFPNEATYFSWYQDFSSVMTIPQSELESYPLGKNITMRPGTKLVKITTNPKVYAVESDGTLRAIPDEATAQALYGDAWNTRIVDVPDAFFTNYTISSEDVSDDAYPEGSLVKFGDGADVYYIDADGSARKIADEAAFAANRFNWDDVITSDLTMPTAGSDITGSEEALTDTSSGAGGTAGAGTGLTVSLASDTPSAGNIPAGSPVDFLKLNFTASNDGDVTINAITLDGYDLGDSTNIDSVTFYDNGVKVGNAKNMNSDRVAAFNFANPVSVPAGTTKSLLVRATIATGQTGNYAIGLASASKVTTNGAVVSGSFPLVGNTKAIVSGTNIGTVSLTNPDTAGDTVQFGDDDILVAQFSLTTANEPVIWESFRLRNAGTNDDSIFSNFRVTVDGDTVVENVSMVDRYVSFDMNNYLIAKGDTAIVDVYGDAGIGNTTDTLNLYAKEANDFSFVGQDYGFGILASIDTSFDGAGDGKTINLDAGDVTIDMDKSAVPAQDVRPGTDNVVLAQFSIVSNGEDATIDQIADSAGEFLISGDSTDLDCNEIENVEMRDIDTGVIYDITVASGTGNTCALTMSDEISLLRGVTKTYEIRTDLQGSTDTNGIDSGDTLKVILQDGAFTITGDTSSDDLSNDITPVSVTSAITTVKTASLTWTNTSLTAKTVVPGAEDIIIYQAQLKAGSASEVRLTSFKLKTSSFASFDDDNFASIEAYLDGKLIKTAGSNAITGDHLSGASINFTSLDSTNRVIPAGATVDLVIKASFASDFGAYTGDFNLYADGTAADIVVRDVDNDTFDESVANDTTTSRTVTLASTGTLKVELKTDDAKADADKYILAGAETTKDAYLGELVFTTANEDVLVEDLVLGRGNTGTYTSSDVANVILYDEDGVEVASAVPNTSGNVHFEDVNLEFAADESTSMFIGVEAKGINVEGDPTSTATHGRNIIFNIASSTQYDDFSLTSGIIAKGADSGETITMTQATTSTTYVNSYDKATTTSKTATLSGAVLTSVLNDLDDGSLVNGVAKTIGKYKMTFDNGSNRTTANEELKAKLVQLDLTVATSTGVFVSNVIAYLDGQPSTKTAAATKQSNTVYRLNLTGLPETGLVDGEVTLIITANVTGAEDNDYVQTVIADIATDSTGDLVYDGNNGSASDDFEDLRLEYTESIGGTLSN